MRANSLPNLAKPKSERLLGLDLIRFFSFYAIVAFHWTAALWAPLGIEYNIASSDPILRWVEIYSRTLAFSGFAVLFLSFFLFGYKGSRLRKRNLFLPLFFVFAAAWILADNEFPYIWDIYPFLIVTFSALVVIEKMNISAPGVAVVAAVITSLPVWNVEATIPMQPWLEQIMWGVCRAHASLGEWPLLPWIGLPLFGWALGQLAATHATRLKSWSKLDWWIWIPLLTLSLPWVGKYYVTRIGDGFGCSIFRQPPWVFWAHQIWILLLIRMSLLTRVRLWLERTPTAWWISARQANQRFFAVYFIHYPLCLWLGKWVLAKQLQFNSLTVNLGLVGIILLTEFGGIVIGRVSRHNSRTLGAP